MAAFTEHRINRLSIEMRTAASQDSGRAFRYRQQLRDDWQQLLPELQTYFDEIDQGSGWLKISKLTLNLRANATGEMLPQLIKSLRTAVEEQLAMAKAARGYDDFDPTLNSEGQPMSASTTVARAKSSPADSHIASDYHILLFYLSHGRLPWFIDGTAAYAHTLHQTVQANREQLQHYLRAQGSYYVYFRVLPWLTATEIVQLLDNMSTETLAKGAAIALVKHWLPDDKQLVSDYRQRVIVASLLTKLQDMTAAVPARETPLAEVQKITPVEWRQWFANQSLTDKQRRALLMDMYLPLVQPAVIERETVGQENNDTGTEIPGLIKKPQPTDMSVSKQQPLPDGQNDLLPTEELSVINVDFAGLVLLHPYIARLFNACDIRVSDNRIPLSRAGTAAALLNYLATGEDQPYEFQLGLIKLLLGLTLEQPLPLAAETLTAAYKQEADHLLETFINHWSVLKNTSANGLRNSFLNRQGYLKQDDNAWSLTLERSGYDVLLDAIPFSYSVVKLPWMLKPIHVDW